MTRFHAFFIHCIPHYYLLHYGLLGTLRFSCLTLLLPLAGDDLGAQSAATPPTFRTSAQLVLIPVTVTDHNGKTIKGLRAEDFNILDDQKPQRITSIG
jgi:hypothetical protein